MFVLLISNCSTWNTNYYKDVNFEFDNNNYKLFNAVTRRKKLKRKISIRDVKVKRKKKYKNFIIQQNTEASVYRFYHRKIIGVSENK